MHDLRQVQDRWSREFQVGLDIFFFSAFYGRICYAFHASLSLYVLKAASNLKIKILSLVSRFFGFCLLLFVISLMEGKISCLLLSDDYYGGGVSDKNS